MTRTLVLAVSGLAWSTALPAQIDTARTLDYLTASVATDVRTTWSNPAGLSEGLEASVIGEVRLDESSDGFRLGQLTAGFNTRGLSILYQRDRFDNDSTGHTWRFGVGSPFEGGALGVAWTWYRGSGQGDNGFDIGLRLVPDRASIRAGVVVRNIGRPVVRGIELPPTGVISLGWQPIRTGFQLSGDVAAFDQSASGLEFAYKGLLSWAIAPLRSTIIAAVTADEGFDHLGLSVGFSIGFDDQILALPSFDRNAGGLDFSTVSVTGLSTRNLLLR